MIAILDYGMGNLRSVEKALARIGADAERTADHARIQAADGLVLPGVGAFPEAMERIRRLSLDEIVRERAAVGTPVIGICLGMQLLFERSEELGGAEGLGLLGGTVRPLRSGGLKVPHMGWSPVAWRGPSVLCDGLVDPEPFYFVHSLVPEPADPDDVLGEATHGESFCAVVARGNVYGAQFHPEKSSTAGLRLLENFGDLCLSAGAENAVGSAPERQ